MGLKKYWDEKWETVDLSHLNLRKKYSISNYGRIISYKEKMEVGKILKATDINGYAAFRYRQFVKTDEGTKPKSSQIYIHRLVGEYHLGPKPTEDHIYILHLDYNKLNNHISNLRWATKREMEIHQQSSPLVIAARKRRIELHIQGYRKLNEAQVIRLKKKLLDPNRKTRLKILAKQFGVSEMQLHRIKTGQNWGHIKVDLDTPDPEDDAEA